MTMQSHPAFEVILVADPAGLGVRPDLPIKRVAFDRANISDARNLGIAQAAGEVIAFIDDDLLAEPGWLSALTAPFADDRVIAATGWTRNRDGFSWQSRSEKITPAGLPVSLPLMPDTQLLPPPEDGAISTLGTNCAFRATALRAIGGFDPVYAYHLDESDVNLRMASAFPQGLTAIAPNAQVIHSRAGDDLGRTIRAPRDLTQQGLSAAIFGRRHGAPPETACDIVERQRKRLLRQMLDGKLDPFQVPPLLASLRAGLADGASMTMPDAPPPRVDKPPAFQALPARGGAISVIGGWHWQARDLRATADKDMKSGKIVTVVLLTPTALPHRIILTENGWFEQHGGVWGRSEPEEFVSLCVAVFSPPAPRTLFSGSAPEPVAFDSCCAGALAGSYP